MFRGIKIKMVSMEINMIKEVIPLSDIRGFGMLFGVVGIIGIVSSFYGDPKSWGLIGFVVSRIKLSPNTKIKKGGKNGINKR